MKAHGQERLLIIGQTGDAFDRLYDPTSIDADTGVPRISSFDVGIQPFLAAFIDERLLYGLGGIVGEFVDLGSQTY